MAASPATRTTALPQLGQGLGAFWPQSRQDLDDLRDDLAGLFDAHGVADAHVEALDVILIVKRGARDRGARQLHRLQVSHRRERARTTHVDADAEHSRGGALCTEFVGDGPTRKLGSVAEDVLLGEAVHLDDGAVDFVGVVRALARDAGNGRVKLLQGRRQDVPAMGRQAEFGRALECRGMARREVSLQNLPNQDAQSSLGHLLRIEHAQ